MVKNKKVIALAVGMMLAVMVAGGIAVAGAPAAGHNEDKQSHLTNEQQDRVNDKLNVCFDRGDC